MVVRASFVTLASLCVACGEVKEVIDAAVDASPSIAAPALSNAEIDENWQAATRVGTLSVEGSSTATFALASGLPECDDADNASFEIAGTELITAEVFDAEAKATYTICVAATDAVATAAAAFVITVLDRAELATGADHTCAIRADRTLWCWGADSDGQLGNGAVTGAQQSPVQVPGAGWASVTASSTHTCAIRGDGSLWCWGGDDSGQLGNADAGSADVPQQVGAETTWQRVSAGDAHTCATRIDGTLWCWGSDASGQLGNVNTGSQQEPSGVPGTTWIDVSAGEAHTCAVQSDGMLACWGSGTDGRIGDGEMLDRSSPANIPSSGAAWKSVTVGRDHTCATRTDGTLWCWGGNSTGQLGMGDAMARLAPTEVIASGVDWNDARVIAGSRSTCATAGGALFCWGTMGGGAISSTPTRLASDVRWLDVDAGVNHWCASRDDRSLTCWGSDDDTTGANATGKLGNGPYDNASFAVPHEGGVYVPDWIEIAASNGSRGGFSTQTGHTCALRSDRTLWCWGNDAIHQLGIDAIAMSFGSPARVGMESTWASVAGGCRHTCATRDDGTLWCWGDDGTGQLGNGSSSSATQAAPTRVNSATDWELVRSSRLHTLALKTNGALYCWGFGARCGVGMSSTLTAPVRIGTAAWKDVSAGVDTSCAIRSDDQLYCWGNGAAGTGLVSTTPVVQGDVAWTWKRVSAGEGFACAIRSNDELYCWGSNLASRLGVGEASAAYITSSPRKVGTATWRAISAGQDHACGIQTDGSLWCWGENAEGRLGIGASGGTRSTPQRVGTETTWASVSAAWPHSCATRTDGTAWCWGSDASGELGNGTTMGDTATPTFVPARGPTVWAQ